MTPGHDYVVVLENEGYGIISRKLDWNRILYDDRMPTICPFFEEIQIAVLDEFCSNTSDRFCKKAFSVLLNKYEFLLVAFSIEGDNFKEKIELYDSHISI
jgi:hypothetical protein